MTQQDAEDPYRNEYRPAWALAYAAHDLPTGLTVFPGPDFDGGAIEGMVFIYGGVLGAGDEIVTFALVHEMSHVVQTRVGQRHGLSLPDTENEAGRGKRPGTWSTSSAPTRCSRTSARTRTRWRTGSRSSSSCSVRATRCTRRARTACAG